MSTRHDWSDGFVAGLVLGLSIASLTISGLLWWFA